MPRHRKLTLLTTLLSGSGAAPSWNAADYGTVIQWLDADYVAGLFQDSARTTLATADSDVVGAISDRYTNGYHSTQGTTGNKPILKLAQQNGRNLVRYDGSSDYTSVTFGASYTQPNTIFLVANLKSTSADFIYDTPSGTNRTVFSDSSGVSLTMNNGTGLSYAHTLPTGVKLWRLVMNGASSAIFRNGVSVASGNAGANAITGFILGARFSIANWGELDFYEKIVYAGTLTAGNITSVESHMTSKWGIS